MSTAILTSNGRIALPANLRRALSLESGTRIEFFRQADGVYALRPLSGSARDIKGIVQKPPKHIAIAQMDRAIAATLKQRNKSSRA